MKKDIEWHIIPALDRDYCVSRNGIFPVKIFNTGEIGKELKKTPNVFRHPDADLDLAFSYPPCFKKMDALSLEEITDGISLMKAVSHRSLLEYQFKLLDDPESNQIEMPEPDIFIDQQI